VWNHGGGPPTAPAQVLKLSHLRLTIDSPNGFLPERDAFGFDVASQAPTPSAPYTPKVGRSPTSPSKSIFRRAGSASPSSRASPGSSHYERRRPKSPTLLQRVTALPINSSSPELKGALTDNLWPNVVKPADVKDLQHTYKFPNRNMKLKTKPVDHFWEQPSTYNSNELSRSGRVPASKPRSSNGALSNLQMARLAYGSPGPSRSSSRVQSAHSRIEALSLSMGERRSNSPGKSSQVSQGSLAGAAHNIPR